VKKVWHRIFESFQPNLENIVYQSTFHGAAPFNAWNVKHRAIFFSFLASETDRCLSLKTWAVSILTQ
jgi:hypothetical protein